MKEDTQAKFIEVLEQHKGQILRICSIYTSNAEDRKDLFQDIIVHIWNSMDNFAGKSSMGTWIYRISLNVSMRFRSKKSKALKNKVSFESIEYSIYAPAEETGHDKNLRLIALRGCIRQLNEGDRSLVVLYLEELPYKEIANILGITENHVAVKIKRIKKKLLHCLNKNP